jgi:hypothetical protein
MRGSHEDEIDEPGVKRALNFGSTLFDSKLTPLTVKTAYFDRQIVGIMRACAVAGAGVEEYVACARREITGTSFSFSGGWGWSAPPPKFEPWSGVREQTYRLDPDLAFAGADRATRGAGGTWPFDFLIQISFTSPAFAAARSRPWFADDNSEVDDHVDEQPWLYQDMQPALTAAIVDTVARDPVWGDVFANVGQYTLLQRLFRAAFSGGLGAQFPVTKLSDLAKEVAPLTRREQTPRWNVRPGQLEFDFARILVRTERDIASVPKYQPLGERMIRCVNEMGLRGGQVSPSQIQGLARISPDSWDRQCNFEPFLASFPELKQQSPSSSETDQVARAVIHASIETRYARELRRTLGIVEEDARMAAGPGRCGPL